MARLRTIAPHRARRIALGAQGFADRRPAGAPDVRHFRRVLDRMAILQLDSVNVLCRSHFMPVYARLGPYDRDKLDQWLWRSGENHEYLAHEASITAMDLYPILAHRMAEGRWQSGVKLERERPDYLAAVRDEVAEQGPLSVKQLSDPGERRGPWWGYSNGKLALEWLYVTGRLAIHHRDRTFTTHYDLPERVVPGELLGGPHADEPAANLDMLRRAARSLGIATERDLADYFRLRMPVARPLIAELVNGGELEPVEVPGWDEPTYLTPGAASPRRIEAATFLSPFDPIVWFRPRAERVFGFRYRIEIYVPEPDRVYGYYVLPFLLGDELVGRCDLKADRGTGTLLVQGSYAEADADPDRTTAAMAPALWQLARWLDLDSVVVKPRGDLAGRLAAALPGRRVMATAKRFSVLAVVVTGLGLLGTLGPWLRTGRAERNSYQVLRSVQRLDLPGLTFYRLVWFLLPVMWLAALLGVLLGRWRLAPVASGASCLVMVVGALVAITSPHDTRWGPRVTLGLAVLGIAVAGMAAFAQAAARRRRWHKQQ